MTRFPSPRSDAAASRDALLDAAVRVLLRDGQRAPLDAIAREAAVGIATLYRNFADREELAAEVVHRSHLEASRTCRASARDPLPRR